MKQQLAIISIVVCAFSTCLYAASSQPEMCPGVNAIKAAPFFIQKDFTTSGGANYYTATQEDQKYDTNWKEAWHFEVVDIEAASIEDARQMLNNVLPTLSFKEGPRQVGNLGWNCDYDIGSEYKAYAATDAAGGLRHSLRR